MTFAKAPNLVLFALCIFYLSFNCFCLSIDDSLKRKENFVTVDRTLHPNEEHVLTDHLISKRSVTLLSQDNITAKIERLNVNHQQLLVHWTGNKSNVFICLARNNWDHLIPNRSPVPSSVHISYDYGKTYVNKTELFTLPNKNNSYASLDKFYNHGRNHNYMIFLDKSNRLLYVTKDYGETITRVVPPFQPMDIAFYPEDPLIFLGYDINRTLWITRDFGNSFTIVQEFVKSYAWADRWTGTWTDTPTRPLLVQRIEPYSDKDGTTLVSLGNLVVSNEPNITEKMANIEEFNKLGDFIFVTRNVSANHFDLYISYKGGDFYKAIFDSEHPNNNYHIVDVSEVRIMVAVAHNETLSNLYVSEVVPNSNYMFRLSLERLFCYFPKKMWKSSWLNDVTEEIFADLHKVKGMRGIYLASQVSPSTNSLNLNPEHLQTLITFDWGGEWKPITPPTVNELGQPIVGCKDSCSLHLTQKFMNLYPYTKTVPILTSESAPGLIIATGVLGKSMKGPTGVFVSRDAGLTWKKVLRDDYMFNFGDHGGIMAAVKNFKASETQLLSYSTDEGESWKNFRFINESIKVYNLMTERGENTTVFTLFGSEVKKHGWIIITVDLRNAFKYNCTKEDYKPWSPTGGFREKKTKSICVMGEHDIFDRRIQHSNCYNGRDFERPIKKEPCFCDIEDFECDFGFARHVHSSGCIRNKSVTYDPYKIPDTCKPGMFYNRTKGYRKIDGDSCFGGYEWQYLPELIPCPFNETSNFLIVALKKQILRFDLANPEPAAEELPVKNLSNIISIDFDVKENCIFYADTNSDIIARQCLSGKESPEVLVENGLSSVEGIAYDWISKLLYFTDGTRSKIEAVRTDISYSNRMRITILDSKTIVKPRGIALHPAAGYMYWTDWSKTKPHVGRANLNGSDVRYLFTSPKVSWPNGITIDYMAEQIYWVDAKLDYIAAADLHGHNYRIIVKTAGDREGGSHPFALAIFKDRVYWDDWELKRIYFTDKDHGPHGVSVQTITKDTIEGLMDLKVFGHPSQKKTNACSNSSSVCSHLCFAQPDNLPPVCACPDDMIMKDAECLCSDGSRPFANHTCPIKRSGSKPESPCSSVEFMCANNFSCIPMTWKCNGANDCGDNSDEIDCPFQTCRSDEFRCKNGRCIPGYWKCDKDIDCPDESDEWNCPKRECQKNEFQCDDKTCISQRWRCDGENDCKDQSDELHCLQNTTKNLTCTDKQFECSGEAKLCIPKSWVCDNVIDCKDKSDEKNCTPPQECSPIQIQCEKTKRCIYKMWQCDGDYDCGEGDISDEANCTQKTSTTEMTPVIFIPCREFMFQCSDNKCIPEWWKCDGVADCRDHSDEIGCDSEKVTTPSPQPTSPTVTKCNYNEFKCGSGECIPSAWTCDSNTDCNDNSDEVNCTNNGIQCPTGYLPCHFSSSCYSKAQVCNGEVDCPDHSDEKDCNIPPPTGTPECLNGYKRCPEGLCIAMYKWCDGNIDCFDAADETDCEKYERVYQAREIYADARRVTPSSIRVTWRIDKPDHLKLEYLPSIAPVVTSHYPQAWKNATAWVELTDYTFYQLRPYSQYNITVYVRVNGTCFTPTSYLTQYTAEDFPGPPTDVTAVQKGKDMAEVKWIKPVFPNGVIKQYVVYSSPPIPPLETTVKVNGGYADYTVLISTHFQSFAEYSFWVVSENGAGYSNNSNVFKLVSERVEIGAIEQIGMKCTNDVLCTATWKEVEGATGYIINVYANEPYPKAEPIIVNNTTSYAFKNLAPGVYHKLEAKAYYKSLQGPIAVLSFTTGGAELPTINEIEKQITLDESGYIVTLTWKAPESKVYNDSWEYGIYYGTNAQQLYAGPRNRTTELKMVIKKLQACEIYLFSVGVVGPKGHGPLSKTPLSVTTGYHKNSPPKGVTVTTDQTNDTLMIVSWNSSCFEMKQPIGYTINVEDVVKSQKASVSLLATNSTTIRHSIVAHYGGRYKVTVQTFSPDSLKSPEVDYWAPFLPTPSQVKLEPFHNNTAYFITWRIHPNLLHMPKHSYEVLLCKAEIFNESHAEIFEANDPHYFIQDLEPGAPYSVAVRLVSEAGYRSAISEINNLMIFSAANLGLNSASMVGGNTSVGSVFLFVSIGVFVVILSLILGVYIAKHHRLRNSFASFANSHYSTSSGAAIFTDRLDDDDSPVIRGFSDDEPLVVA